MLCSLQGLFTSHDLVNSDSPETTKSLKPNTNGFGLLMDTGLCHLLQSRGCCRWCFPCSCCWSVLPLPHPCWSPACSYFSPRLCPLCHAITVMGWEWSSSRGDQANPSEPRGEDSVGASCNECNEILGEFQACWVPKLSCMRPQGSHPSFGAGTSLKKSLDRSADCLQPFVLSAWTLPQPWWHGHSHCLAAAMEHLP